MMVDDEYRKIANACERIRGVFPPNIETAIILGSGLSDLMSSFQQVGFLPYSDIPHFPMTTVSGHTGNLFAVQMGETIVYILQGRFHYYEGYSTREATFPIRVLAELGIKQIILTNSAGGLSPDMVPGDLMLISDHLSFFCDSPLRGPNLDRFGPRFPDQTSVYDSALNDLALRLAEKLTIRLHTGTYAYMKGPQYETPAEIHVLSVLGTSAVGMSTVPEAIAASHCGIRVLGLSCISNMASGMSGHPLSHEAVLQTANETAHKMIKLIEALIQSEPFC